MKFACITAASVATHRATSRRGDSHRHRHRTQRHGPRRRPLRPDSSGVTAWKGRLVIIYAELKLSAPVGPPQITRGAGYIAQSME